MNGKCNFTNHNGHRKEDDAHKMILYFRIVELLIYSEQKKGFRIWDNI